MSRASHRFVLLCALFSGGWCPAGVRAAPASGVEPPAVGARALALGGAFVTAPDPATAFYWNPAGAASWSARPAAVGFEYRRQAARLSVQAASAVFRSGVHPRFAWGFAARFQQRDALGAADVWSGPGDPGASQLDGRILVALGFHNGFAVGGTLGGRTASPRDAGVRGFVGGLGVRWERSGTRVAVAVPELGFGLRDASGPVARRYTASAGVAQRLPGSPETWTLLQVERPRGGPVIAAAGLEVATWEALHVQAGIRRVPESAEAMAATGAWQERPGTTWSLGWRLDGKGAWQWQHTVRFGVHRGPEHLIGVTAHLGSAGTVQPVPRSPRRWGARETSRAPAPTAAAPAAETAPPTRPPSASTPAAEKTPSRSRSPQRTRSTPRALPRATQAQRMPTEPPSDRSAEPEDRTPPVPPAVRPPRAGSAPAARPAEKRQARRVRPFVVRAGVYEDMDAAALEVARFYRATLRATLERRGRFYVVVVRRCATRAEAEDWLRRVREAGLEAVLDEE